MRYDVMKIETYWNFFFNDQREKNRPRQNQFSNNRLLIDLLIDLCTQAISSLSICCAIINPAICLTSIVQ